MRTLLISPTSQIVADRVARDYTEAVLALQQERYDMVLLDGDAEKWYRILLMVEQGFCKKPGQVVAFGKNEHIKDVMRQTIDRIYDPGASPRRGSLR